MGLDERLRAELAEHRAYLLVQDDLYGEAVTELKRAAFGFEQAEMPWHALAARARSLVWLATPDDDTDAACDAHGADSEEGRQPAGAERPDPALIQAGADAALRAVERLKTKAPLTGESLGEGERTSGHDVAAERVLEYLVALYSCTFVAFQEALRAPEESSPATQKFEKFVHTFHDEAERWAAPHQAANARQLAAELADRRDDAVRAEAELRAAVRDVDASGRPWRGSRPRALLAQILLAKDEPAEAAELLHQAITDAVRHGDTGFPPAPTYALLGRAASYMGISAAPCATSRRPPRASTRTERTKKPPKRGLSSPASWRTPDSRPMPPWSWNRSSATKPPLHSTSDCSPRPG
ncbi:hypothetical protein [Streptomyces sp. Ac-502]|uniref:hypothetical protein n=1 Tax=Streptomyces sp. Ac-502 TaxID=3342801 RepID=UPI00386287A0